MNMDLHANETSTEVIKKGSYVGTYFRDIYSGINGKLYRKSWKEFQELKILAKNIIVQIIMMLV